MASTDNSISELSPVESESAFHLAMADHSVPDATPLLDESAFYNKQSKRLFEAIDELRRCGASHDIDLPELVIVGDQSAGKSSLLQSLTDIPFPVADRLCTRFPTRIVSRRTLSRNESYRISIEQGLSSGFAHRISASAREQYHTFTRTPPNLTPEDFKALIKEATELLLPSVAEEAGKTIPASKSNFSSDVLKIEIAGPTRNHVSIIDVPGVFQSRTKNLTEWEKEGVKQMVEAYMKSPQSIIICVASGTNDLANQAAFDMASKYDPDGKRTVGIITKCDATQHVDQVMDLAQNKEKRLHHGWFVVRNRTPQEAAQGIDSAERARREEQFFASEPWNRLDRNRCGTAAVSEYLARLLSQRIEKTFPTLLRTIHNVQASTAEELARLGPSRKSLEDQRAYLASLAQEFHSLALQALRGRYDNVKEEMRLRRIIRDANDSFARNMKISGHCTPFLDIPNVLSLETPQAAQTESGGGLFGASNLASGTSGASGFGAFGTSKFGTSGASGLGGFGTSNFGTSGASGLGGFGTSNSGTSGASGLGGFGTSNSGTSGASGFGAFGTSTSPFQATVKPDLSDETVSHFQSITMMPSYQKYSFEELRLADYPQGSNGKSSTTPPTRDVSKTSPFGVSGGLFGKGGLNTFANTGNVGADRSSVEIYKWIRREIENCRGTELQGTLNPDVLPTLFHKQARNWERLSKEHFNIVTTHTLSMALRMTDEICKDDSYTKERIQLSIRQANEEAKSRGLALLSGRLKDILNKHLQTNNKAFEEKIKQARLLRFQNALKRYKAHAIKPFGGETIPDNEIRITLWHTSALFDELHMSNTQNLEDEIHDILKAYYEIARDNFVEFVTQMVVEQYLDDEQGPVLSFSPVYVGKLPDAEVEALAAEEQSVSRQREEKQATLERLAKAKKIALKYSYD